MTTSADKIIRQIALLLARADHPNTPVPEAELCRERADIMMAKHRISEASLSTDERARQGIRPMDSIWIVCPWSSMDEFRQSYYAMAFWIVSHIGAQAHFEVRRMVDPETNVQGHFLVAHVFGFESDLRYGAILLQAARAGFGRSLEPKVDPTLSDEANVYALRSAGVERIRIARLMGWGETGSATSKVTRLFKKACADNGEDAAILLGRGNNVKTFRKSYADSFSSEIRMRLLRMRQASAVEDRAMVLVSRTQEVNNMFWSTYPQYKPVPESSRIGEGAKGARIRKQRVRKYVERPFNAAASERGREAASRIDLGPTAGTNRIGG
jgi:hypothetical protein